MAEEVPYQQAGMVAQLRAERELAEAYGQTSRVEAVDKQLAELGVKTPAKAAEERAAAAEEDEAEAKASPPKNRASRASRQQTAGGG